MMMYVDEDNESSSSSEGEEEETDKEVISKKDNPHVQSWENNMLTHIDKERTVIEQFIIATFFFFS
jgi:hypothetical protein